MGCNNKDFYDYNYDDEIIEFRRNYNGYDRCGNYGNYGRYYENYENYGKYYKYNRYENYNNFGRFDDCGRCNNRFDRFDNCGGCCRNRDCGICNLFRGGFCGRRNGCCR